MNHLSTKLPKVIGAAPSIGKGYKTPSGITSIDLTIYEHPNTECSRSPDDIPITERCSALKRLCTANLYFDALSTSKSVDETMKRALFVEFNEVVYGSFLEDTVHLVKEHDGDIRQIHAEWTERYGVPKCTVSDCTKTARHYGRGRRDRKRESESEEEDALYAFYESLLDRVHHFVAHLFEIGLRVEASSLTLSEGGGDEKEAESEGVAVDKLFAAERDHIKSRRKELKLDSERMSPENTKFTIQTVAEQQGLTLTDALFEELAENEKVHRETLQRLHLFLDRNAFDSEGVDLDLEDVADSNLYPLIQSQSVAETMSNFIRSINCMLSLSLCGNVLSLSFYLSLFVSWSQCVAVHSPPDSLSIIGRTAMK